MINVRIEPLVTFSVAFVELERTFVQHLSCIGVGKKLGKLLSAPRIYDIKQHNTLFSQHLSKYKTILWENVMFCFAFLLFFKKEMTNKQSENILMQPGVLSLAAAVREKKQ